MSPTEIIEILDDYLITTGKKYISLRVANDLLFLKTKKLFELNK